jgi:two-component system response regulator TrcR
MDKIKVLLVEDEAVLAMIIKETLDKRGFDIRIAKNGIEGWSLFNQDKPEVCIVDVMMPRKDGISLVRDIRMVDNDIPVIFLTAKTQTEDVIKGLEAGADDYLKKPFSMEELILRLKRFARHKPEQATVMEPENNQISTIGGYTFNFQRLELIKNDQVTSLSQREAELLELLILHKNKLLDRRAALLKLWGDDNVMNARSMDVYITRLRKYLNDSGVQLLNVRGKGYRLVE